MYCEMKKLRQKVYTYISFDWKTDTKSYEFLSIVSINI